jgi:hypothetical protein
MDGCVRKVTELEIRRLALGLDRPKMAIQLELCCEEGGGSTPAPYAAGKPPPQTLPPIPTSIMQILQRHLSG